MKRTLISAASSLAFASVIFGQASWTELRQQGLAAYRSGNYRTAQVDLLQSRQASGGDNAPEETRSLLASDLAVLYQVTGRYRDAESLLEEARQSTVRRLGPQSLQAAVLLSRIASVYADEGRYADADRAGSQALASLGPAPSTERSAAQRTLGNVRIAEDRVEEALVLHKKALATDRDHSRGDVGEDLADVGRDEYKLGRLQEAEQSFQEALQSEGGETRNQVVYATELNNFGQVEAALGHAKQAEGSFRTAVAIWTQQLGPRHVFVASGLSNLAALYASKRHFNRAEELYSQALAIHREALGGDSPQVAQDLNNLGTVYFGQKKFSEAESVLQDALRISRKQGQVAAVQTALETLNLAEVCAGRGEYERSEVLYRDGVAALEQTWGDARPQLAPILESYAAVLRARRNFAEAERVEVKAMHIKVENTLRLPG